MIKFGATNIRRINEPEPIEIKPITLLLGRNSSGKSSFLRLFALLRQSLMTKTSSPILWYGDYVDFGSFETTLSRTKDSDSMSFIFSAPQLSLDRGPLYIGPEHGYIYRPGESVVLRDTTYRASIVREGERTRISSISIRCTRPFFEICADFTDRNFASRLTINGVDIIPLFPQLRIQLFRGSIFPDIIISRVRDDNRKDHWSPYYNFEILPDLISLLRANFDLRYKDGRITDLARRLISAGLPDRDRVLNTLKSQGPNVAGIIDRLLTTGRRSGKPTLTDIMYLSSLADIFRVAGAHFGKILSSTLYIGPARARSERYYRYQDLSVSEIDPDGKNFPMFLNSLTVRQFSAFSEWVRQHFDYGVSISRRSGHISINLSDGSSETNIVDVGYGVSQILPVLGQIWWARHRTSSRTTPNPVSLLCIEQPELHLHPAHQSLLADALVGEASASSSSISSAPIYYIVETHSEMLVNRLGELIAQGKIEHSSVQILLFDPFDDVNSKIKIARYDPSGILVDWPYGFFNSTV